ncbi:282_t:CDS:2 [Funneliformis geosporum]|uniref:16367_t:CDS:1 n=1 Tax=Funneliformis geosporum TaxID=1117311 RepID=A0A9W4SCL5_9GLOM|nr:16367_t:CDS:2 [Funneliformis geosporum]CAI2172147.1 282_t:CDS:2 [Funneliformis geosporum]
MKEDGLIEIKPENILVENKSPLVIFLITDFGMSSKISSNLNDKKTPYYFVSVPGFGILNHKMNPQMGQEIPVATCEVNFERNIDGEAIKDRDKPIIN